MEKSQRKFAEKMLAEVRRAGWDGPLELDEEGFRLVSGPSSYLNLHNAFVEYERAPRLRRGEVIRRYATVANAPGFPDSAAEARPNLLLQVRDHAWFEQLVLQYPDLRDGRGPGVTCEPLNDLLAIEIVYDHPQSIASLAPDTLEGWEISPDEAFRVGRANLRDRTPGTLAPVAAGVFTSPWHDGYDAARLLLTELISRLDLEGDPVALIPQRDHLYVTGSDDDAGLGRIAAIAEPLLQEPRRVTGHAFVWRDGSWMSFAPEPGHPQHLAFRRLVYITEAQNYNEQKAVLDQQNQAAGRDVFVASVMVTERPDTAALISMSTWTLGVPTLLPRADTVVFVAPGANAENRIVRVPWEEAVAVMGESMAPQGLFLERWLVETFPDAGQLAELEARSGS